MYTNLKQFECRLLHDKIERFFFAYQTRARRTTHRDWQRDQRRAAHCTTTTNIDDRGDLNWCDKNRATDAPLKNTTRRVSDKHNTKKNGSHTFSCGRFRGICARARDRAGLIMKNARSQQTAPSHTKQPETDEILERCMRSLTTTSLMLLLDGDRSPASRLKPGGDAVMMVTHRRLFK